MKKIQTQFHGNLRATIFLLVACFLFTGLAGLMAQEQKAPAKYKKILVYAKIRQAPSQHELESTMAKALKDKGYEAITSWENCTPEDTASIEKLLARANALQVDAILAFTVLSLETTVKNTPPVTASVGVPVHVGFASVFVGTSVPLGGGPKAEQTATVKASLYAKESKSAIWYLTLKGKLGDDPTPLINEFVKKTTKGLQKDKVL